jgi:Flp pilus assembly protein TadG
MTNLIHGMRHRRHRPEGQALVEFSLVIPIFLVFLTAIVEFSLVLNANLALDYATRDAALIGAEAGNSAGADCVILTKVEQDVSAPADSGRITAVEIYWSDQNGNLLHGQKNVWNRTGSTTCTFPDGTTTSVPYTAGSLGYLEANRCNIEKGCGGLHTPSVDTIGVKVTYSYPWHTPLRNLLNFAGSGWMLSKSNAMRMEPIL